jgi:hypothetical protein
MVMLASNMFVAPAATAFPVSASINETVSLGSVDVSLTVAHVGKVIPVSTTTLGSDSVTVTLHPENPAGALSNITCVVDTPLINVVTELVDTTFALDTPTNSKHNKINISRFILYTPL